MAKTMEQREAEIALGIRVNDLERVALAARRLRGFAALYNMNDERSGLTDEDVQLLLDRLDVTGHMVWIRSVDMADIGLELEAQRRAEAAAAATA